MSDATRGDPSTNTETSESAPDSKTTQPSTPDSDAVQPKPAQESDKENDGSSGDKVVPNSVEKETDGSSGDKEMTEPVEKGTDGSSGDKEVTETVEKATDGSSDDKEVTESDEIGTDKSDDTLVDKKESDTSDSIAKTESVVSSSAEKSDSVNPSDSTGGKIADNEGTSDARVETIATRYADLVASSEAADSAEDESKLATHTAGDSSMLASIIRTISPGGTVTSVLEGDAEATELESSGDGGDIASDTPAGGSINSNNPDGGNVISNKPTGDGNIVSSKPVSGNIISNNSVEGNVNANKLVSGGANIIGNKPAGVNIISNNPAGGNVITNKPMGGGGNIISNIPGGGNIIGNSPAGGNIITNNLMSGGANIIGNKPAGGNIIGNSPAGGNVITNKPMGGGGNIISNKPGGGNIIGNSPAGGNVITNKLMSGGANIIGNKPGGDNIIGNSPAGGNVITNKPMGGGGNIISNKPGGGNIIGNSSAGGNVITNKLMSGGANIIGNKPVGGNIIGNNHAGGNVITNKPMGGGGNIVSNKPGGGNIIGNSPAGGNVITNKLMSGGANIIGNKPGGGNIIGNSPAGGNVITNKPMGGGVNIISNKPGGGNIIGNSPAGGNVITNKLMSGGANIIGNKPAGGNIIGNSPAGGNKLMSGGADVIGNKTAGGNIIGNSPAGGNVITNKPMSGGANIIGNKPSGESSNTDTSDGKNTSVATSEAAVAKTNTSPNNGTSGPGSGLGSTVTSQSLSANRPALMGKKSSDSNLLSSTSTGAAPGMRARNASTQINRPVSAGGLLRSQSNDPVLRTNSAPIRGILKYPTTAADKAKFAASLNVPDHSGSTSPIHPSPLANSAMNRKHSDKSMSSTDGATSVTITHTRASGVQEPSEVTALLKRITEDSDADSDNYDEVHGWLNHLQETLVLSVPHAANILIHLGPEVIAALYLGTLGHAAFGSAALATAYMSITGNTWGISLISALDTLASPLISMNEAQGYESQALQRTWLLLLVMSLPITFLWLCSYQVLTLVGVDSVIADQAADYCRFSLPGLWGMFLFESLKKVVQGTGADGQAMIKTITIFATLWMIVVGWFLITSNSLGMGYVGVAITRAGMWWMMAVWAGMYLVVKGWFKANWTGWSHEAFYEWSTHLWLSGSCLMVMVTELWPVELIVVVAGCMDSRQLAVAGILVQFLSFGSLLPFAISVASTQRIDTFMRKAVPSDCQRAAVVSSLTILLFEALYCLALYLLRYQAPRLFTVDSSTIVISTEAILYMNVYLCVDALLTSCRNVLRTFHRQQITFLLNVVCNYILGMPLALLFAFKFEDDLQGLYKGMSIGAGVQCGILVAVAFYFSDWNTEIWRLHARLNGETVKEWYDDEEDDEQHQLPTHVNGGTYGTHTA